MSATKCPGFGISTQPGANGIMFDVCGHARLFSRVANNAVVVLALLKVFALAIKDSVSHTRRVGFNFAHDGPEWTYRFHNHVNVIGHDDPGIQSVVSAIFAEEENVANYFCDPGFFQPEWARLGLIQNFVGRRENLPLAVSSDCALADWDYACERPCDKEFAAERVFVRQSAGVFRERQIRWTSSDFSLFPGHGPVLPNPIGEKCWETCGLDAAIFRS